MVKRYIKKPAPIQAIQIDGHNFDEIAAFSGGNFLSQEGKVYVMPNDRKLNLELNDYLVKREDGTLTVMKPNAFDAEYEEQADSVERIRAIWKD